MSFKCKKCGCSKPRVKQERVPAVIREVIYTIRVAYIDRVTRKIKYKVRNTVKGFEIVREDSYCKDCLPSEIKPEIRGHVKRVTTIPPRKKRGRR